MLFCSDRISPQEREEMPGPPATSTHHPLPRPFAPGRAGARVREAFEAFDGGRKGWLERRELKCAMAALLGYRPSRLEVRWLLERAGAGGGPAGPPRTQEEAYSQARAALGSAFEAKKRRGGKKSTRAGKGPRVRVEIPLPPEVSEKAADEVVALLDGGSFVGRGTPLDVRFASPELAALAECPTLSSAAPPPAGAVLVAIGPTAADLTALNALVQRFDWAGAIVVNPEGWEARSVDQSLIPFTRTFEIAYSFLPLSIQGLLGSTSNGAVFRSVEGAKTPAAVPWRIYLMDEDPPKQIAETTKRPGDAEIETTLYNSMAQESPINQGIRAVRTAGEGLMNLLPGREGK